MRARTSALWSRRHRGAARLGAGVVALALVGGLGGCSTVRQIPIDSIPPGGTGKAKVTTTDGYTYNFERVFAREDSLVGEYSVVEERSGGGNAIAYVDVVRSTALPLTRVSHISIKQLDYANTALLGAGAVLFGVLLTATDEEKKSDEPSGNVKRNPSFPLP